MNTNQTLYFIGILPPEPILSEIHELKMDLSKRYNTQVALRSPPHITLYKPFGWNENEEELLSEHLVNFFKQTQAFEIVLNGFGCFSPKVLFVKPKENPLLSKVHKALVLTLKEKLAIDGYKKEKRDFHAHMTIANRDLAAKAFEEAWESLSKQVYNNKFMVDKASLLRHNGRVWEVVADYKLQK